nr:hypothetical protein [Tanacetum cinerariifolium]
MEKNVISSCTNSEEMEIQKLQKKASIMKDSFLNGLSALKSKFTLLSKKDVPVINASEFERAFSHIFGEYVYTFTGTFSQNIATLETQLTNKTLHEPNCQTAFRVLKTPFDKIFTSMLIKSSHLDATYSRKDFQAYNKMQPQDLKERILKDFDFIQKYMIESILNDKEIDGIDSEKRLIAARLGMIKAERIKVTHLEMKAVGQGMIALKEALLGMIRTSDLPMTQNQWLSNTTPNSSKMCNNEFKDDQNADDHEDDRVVLANLIANLKLNINENKKTQNKLRNVNTTLTHELKECKYTLEETNRTLGESNRTRDRYLVAVHDKEVELAKYKTFKDHTIEKDTLKRQLKETLGLLAQKEHDIQEVFTMTNGNPSSVIIKQHYGRLQEQLDEEENQRIARDAEIAQRIQEEIKASERQRMAQVHQAAQTFIKDEWKNIRARVEADEELTQKLQAKEREKYGEDDRTKMLVDIINQRKKFFA